MIMSDPQIEFVNPDSEVNHNSIHVEPAGGGSVVVRSTALAGLKAEGQLLALTRERVPVLGPDQGDSAPVFFDSSDSD